MAERQLRQGEVPYPGLYVTGRDDGKGVINDRTGHPVAIFSSHKNAEAALMNLQDRPGDWTPTDRDVETLKMARRVLEAQKRQRGMKM